MAKSKILIIEDDTWFQEVLRELLVSEGYEVRTTDKGIDGLSIAKSSRPDCILLDLTLLDMSGIDVLQELQAEAFPIIVLTGISDIATSETVLQLGAYAFLTKPFQAIDVLNVLNELFDETERDDN